jgi:alkylhydroperoxidase/carboxymuconolactone decarboxylase family protein YurZ
VVKRKNRSQSRKSLAFRDLIDPSKARNPEAARIYRELRQESRSVPEIYRVKALADNPGWLRLLDESIFRWPESSVLDDKTRELVGLAKSIAYHWEPGVLTNIEGVLEAGGTAEEITETVLLASSVLGLAELEIVVGTDLPEGTADPSGSHSSTAVGEIRNEAVELFGEIPELYNSKLLSENPDWFAAVHKISKLRYARGILDPKTRALVCLAASAATHWDRGIREHSRMARKSGARVAEIVDVLCSIYKTAASIGVQMGFSVPCDIPRTRGFVLLADHYRKFKKSS